MAYPIYYVPAGDVLPIMFDSFDGGTGASITMTGLAVTDIEIFKDGSVTQRSSDAGYTLLDTDGIDFDGLTGIHGFSIDTGDNTDSGFYTTGAWFHVVVSSITIDAQTVNFIAAAFRIMAAETAAGVPKADVSHYGGTAGTFSSGRPEVNTTHAAGTAWGSGAITAAAVATGAIDADALAADAGTELGTAVWATAARTLTAATNITSTGGTTVPQTGDSYARLGAPAGASVSADIAAIEAQTDDIGVAGAGLTALATQASVDTVAGYIDTEVASILAAVDTEIGAVKTVVDNILLDTAEIGAAGAGLTALATQASVNTIDDLLDTEVAAIKTVVDAILVDTGTTLDGKIDTIDSNVDAVLLDTAEIGAAGAGLTAINLPDQTMNITGDITGNLSGSVGSVTTVSDKTGYALSSAGVDAVLDEVVEGTITMRQLLRLVGAVLGGEVSGAATTTVTIRNASDSKDVVVATVDADGNRSALTLDLT